MSEPDNIAAAKAWVAPLLDEIRETFIEPVRVTVLVRTPGDDERDFTMSDDDPAEVVRMVHRRFRDGGAR